MNTMRTMVFLITFTVPLMSCGEDAVEPCDLWISSAIVSGRVSETASGGAMVNFEVEVVVAESSQCDGTEQWSQSQRVTTDDLGLFSVKLELGNQKGLRCVGVRRSGTGTISRGSVEFVGGCDESRPPGELVLDLAI